MRRKGQINIFMQPVMLIVVISIFAIFVYKTLEVNVSMKKEADDNYFRIQALSVAEAAIACARDESTSYPYLLSAEKLESMNEDYFNDLAPCMRDDSFGWDAVIRTITSAQGEDTESWQIGEVQASTNRALQREFSIELPVAVRKDDGIVVPGMATVTIREGDLEYITGRIESVHRIGSQTGKELTMTAYKLMHYPIFVDKNTENPLLCMQMSDEETICKTLGFEGIEMKEIGKGMHYFVIRYDPVTGITTVDA